MSKPKNLGKPHSGAIGMKMYASLDGGKTQTDVTKFDEPYIPPSPKRQEQGTDMATSDSEATTIAVKAVLKAIYRDGATATPRNLHRDLETITKLIQGDTDV